MKKIYLLGIGLLMSSLNVNAMGGQEMMNEAPFIGINTWKDKCHIIAEHDGFTYQGDAKTKVTMNENFVIATCQARYLMDEDLPAVAIEGRNQVSSCRIKVEGLQPFTGTGGFTVSSGGVVNGNCKAVR
jgi:hypothetical protein